jgi:uncharacterized protein YqfA (UPF0365 family)
MNNDVILVVAIVAALVFLVFLVLFFSVFRLWIQALLSGVPVSVFEIIGMRLRRTPATLIIHAAIVLAQRGRKITPKQIESVYLGYGQGIMTATELVDLVVDKVPTDVPEDLTEDRQ